MVEVALLLALLSLPVLACAAYLGLLVIASGSQPPPAYGEPRIRFDIIVPAHNEESAIAGTVQSLLAIDYPRHLYRVLVVADNCFDSTAERAREAGATVLVRQDDEKRGKGYALAFAFRRVIDDDAADAAIVVDADTIVAPNLLRAFAARFEAGASAVQAEYGVRNPNASWRTRLMVIALATFHGVRSLGRQRLKVSCGLRGNGMGFARQVLIDVPHEAFSIVEDIEYGMRLANAGHIVQYVAEAPVLGEMVSSESRSRSQRQRWEGGRWKLAKLHGLPLLARSIARGDRVLFDIAMDILVPPLTILFSAAVLGLTASAVLLVEGAGAAAAAAAALWALAVYLLCVYVIRGVVLSRVGPRAILDLAWAPVYMGWKLVLSLSTAAKRSPDAWVRTPREDEKP
jgi:cellulose synthase/poly-beta-1,6-N-acetylglucosamine synthase-like glycosyltransferase